MQRWPNTLRRPIVVGIVGVADHDGVLEHRRPGADFDTGSVGADDRAFGEQRSLTEACRADDHRGAGDLRRAGLGLRRSCRRALGHGARPAHAKFRGRELVGGDDAEPAGLVVLDGLDDLLAGVHHEGPVVGDRRADREPAEQEHVERLGLPVGGGHDEMVAGTEHDELAVLDRAALGADGAAAGQHVGQRAERRVPRHGELGAGRERHVGVGDRGVGDARAR